MRSVSMGFCVCVCEVSALNLRLIEYSVYQGCVCVLKLCCCANAAPIEALMQTRTQQRKKRQSRGRRKDEKTQQIQESINREGKSEKTDDNQSTQRVFHGLPTGGITFWSGELWVLCFRLTTSESRPPHKVTSCGFEWSKHMP